MAIVLARTGTVSQVQVQLADPHHRLLATGKTTPADVEFLPLLDAA